MLHLLARFALRAALSALGTSACHGWTAARPAPACPAPAMSAEGWRERRDGEMTYRIPDDYRKAFTVGFNAPAASWVKGQRSIGFQVGLPTTYIDVHADHRVQDLTECAETIGGRQASVVSFRYGTTYYARATWDGAGPGGEPVVFTGMSPDIGGQMEALVTIRSVRFLR